MITRLISLMIATSLVGPIAFGQMRYSREHKSSPTPSPTPTPTPGQKAPFSQLPQTPPPRSFGAPQPTPTPGQVRVPAQRTLSGSQPTATPTLQRIPAQRTFSAPQATATPIQSRIPAQRTVPGQQMAPAQTQSQIPGQRTLAAPQPGTAPMQPRTVATPAPTPAKPTPTPVPPPDVKAYLERQIASSKDKKFHMTVNGKDVPLTPFHFWAPRSNAFNTTSTHIDMRSDDGRIYDIEFATTGAQISSIRIHRINGEGVR